MFEALRNQSIGEAFLDAVVVDNNDPLKLRRLKIRASSIHADTPEEHLPWAICGMPTGQGPLATATEFAVPRNGSTVLVVFQNGDPAEPIYLGGISDSTNVPALFKTNYPNRVGWLLYNGTAFYVDCQTNVLSIAHRGTTITIDANGGISVQGGQNVAVNVAGDATLAVSGNLTSSAANWSHTGNFSLNGNLAASGGTFTHNGKNVGDTHTHNSVQTGGGVSGPPV